jgi:hypothetical protein
MGQLNPAFLLHLGCIFFQARQNGNGMGFQICPPAGISKIPAPHGPGVVVDGSNLAVDDPAVAYCK